MERLNKVQTRFIRYILDLYHKILLDIILNVLCKVLLVLVLLLGLLVVATMCRVPVKGGPKCA